MKHVRAGALGGLAGLGVALLLGSLAGAGAFLAAGRGDGDAAGKAMRLALGISTALNCSAAAAILAVPVGVWGGVRRKRTDR